MIFSEAEALDAYGLLLNYFLEHSKSLDHSDYTWITQFISRSLRTLNHSVYCWIIGITRINSTLLALF
jgi:hypothetical protein